MIFQNPLQWPPTQPRTTKRDNAKFKINSTYKAGVYVEAELRRMKAKNIVITTNLLLNRDGSVSSRQPSSIDPGVAVYFEFQGKAKIMACDKWRSPEQNLWALYLSIEAIRGLERWGGSEFLDGLFTGFTALPSPDMVSKVKAPDYFGDCIDKEDAKQRYRTLAKALHPDGGGSEAEFAELNRQYQEAMKGE